MEKALLIADPTWLTRSAKSSMRSAKGDFIPAKKPADKAAEKKAPEKK
jgi:hypothetical protein